MWSLAMARFGNRKVIVRKLNFGCGDRFTSGWVNIDFYSPHRSVQRVNLLAGFPFPDNSFDAVYSSHVLEHFTRAQAMKLVAEAYRVLKKGGILRIVVPDLEETCREYLRVLNMSNDDPAKKGMYEWIIVELLDQLVRDIPSGEMGPLIQRITAGGDQHLIRYVSSRTENVPPSVRRARGFMEKLRRITPQKIAFKVQSAYLKSVCKLIPCNVRPMVFVGANMGERHRWMYDSYGLRQLVTEAGFNQVRFLRHDDSQIPGFKQDCLDSNRDGRSYKNNSLYLEAVKPLDRP
jgi:SAM-dependent methyltransferase